MSALAVSSAFCRCAVVLAIASPRLRRSLLPVVGFSVWLMAAAALGHGGFHERIADLTAQVKADPSNPLLHLELGNLHGQHRDLHLSLQNLDRVDEMAPGKYLPDLLRGQAYLAADEFAKAKEALDRQVVSHPESARAWLLRARAERALGHDQGSLADYREALKRTASPDPDIVQEVAAALAAQGNKQEAAQVLGAGIEKLGNIPSLVLTALDLEIETKNFDAAMQRIEQAQLGAPRPEPWMARRATVLAQAGRLEESRAAWKALVEHLESLPAQARNSRAMSNLTTEARKALAALDSLP